MYAAWHSQQKVVDCFIYNAIEYSDQSCYNWNFPQLNTTYIHTTAYTVYVLYIQLYTQSVLATISGWTWVSQFPLVLFFNFFQKKTFCGVVAHVFYEITVKIDSIIGQSLLYQCKQKLPSLY